MFKITYRDHGQGATGGTMLRPSISALRTADLLRQCGYQRIDVVCQKCGNHGLTCPTLQMPIGEECQDCQDMKLQIEARFYDVINSVKSYLCAGIIDPDERLFISHELANSIINSIN